MLLHNIFKNVNKISVYVLLYFISTHFPNKKKPTEKTQQHKCNLFFIICTTDIKKKHKSFHQFFFYVFDKHRQNTYITMLYSSIKVSKIDDQILVS